MKDADSSSKVHFAIFDFLFVVAVVAPVATAVVAEAAPAVEVSSAVFPIHLPSFAG